MTPVTKDLVSDLLAATKARQLDLWAFIDYVLANEPEISLEEFRDRLWDEITDNYRIDFTTQRADIHCIVTEYETA